MNSATYYYNAYFILSIVGSCHVHNIICTMNISLPYLKILILISMEDSNGIDILVYTMDVEV